MRNYREQHSLLMTKITLISHLKALPIPTRRREASEKAMAKAACMHKMIWMIFRSKIQESRS